jgi:hypothetical protein
MPVHMRVVSPCLSGILMDMNEQDALKHAGLLNAKR